MKATLQSAMKEAMKARDKVRLDTIRQVLAAIQYEEMQKKTEALSNDAILGILKSEVKKRHESMEFVEKAGRQEEKATLLLEITALESFLPKQFSEAELEKILAGLKAETPGINMGGAMKILKERFAGQYDSKMASEVAKKVLG
jgi:uncharacterized protein YqeY